MATLGNETIRKRLERARAGADRVRQVFAGTLSPAVLLRMLLAVALAFGMWIFVTLRSNPDTTQPIRALTLEQRDLPSGLVLMTGLPLIDVTVIGPEAAVQTPNRPVVVYVDLSGRTPGQGQRLPVQVELPRGVRLLAVSPDEVIVDLEPLVQQEFAVRTEEPSNLPPGLRPDQPTLQPGSVVITGARSTLAEITRVVVRPEAGGDPNDLRRVTRAIPLNRDNREVVGPQLKIEPPTISVTLPAQRATGSRTVPIRPIVQGQPEAGFQIDSIQTTPSVISISGETDVLATVTSLETEPIDINRRQQTLIRMVQLRVPSGVQAEQTTVQIEVGISPIQARTRLTLVAVGRGLGAGLRAQIIPANVGVVLQGPVPRIQAIDVGSLRAEVNLQGLGPGTHQIQPKVTGSGLDGLQVVETTPALVTVQIAAEPTPGPTPQPATPTTAPPKVS
jgi:YbbR domain-containing protein